MQALHVHLSGSSDSAIDVHAKLELLEHDLPLLEVERIRNFNMAYTIITKRVRGAIKKQEFERPEFLQRFDTRFAGYYFDALQGYLKGEPVAPAWEKAFRSSEQRSVSPFKAMILGVNAHVANDIPQVLLDCNAGAEHYRDFMHVNKIIGDGIRETLGSLQNDSQVLSPKRSLLRPLYIPFIRLLIFKWRWSTWHRYQRMLRSKADVRAIEHGAGRKARLLALLPV